MTATADGRFDPSGFHPIFRRLLTLESRAEKLLSYRTEHLPFWSLIRLPLLARLLDRVQGEDSARDIFLKPRRFGIGTVLRYVATSIRRSPFRYSNRDVVLFCSGTNRMRENGAFFNTRVDYFLEPLAGQRTLLIEGAQDLRYAWPRTVGPVSCRGGLTVPAALRARVSRLSRNELAAVEDFMALLGGAFDGVLDASDCALLQDNLKSSILRARAYYADACRLLARLKPRLVLLEGGHSGFDVEFLTAARECGIVTVEYQHGAINPFCPYHNFHPALLQAGYDRHLPDYFLSYGDFWNALLMTSARVVTIGHPHIEAVRRRMPRVARRPDSVYFLSSANSPQKYMAQLRDLAQAGFTPVFRPHPAERPLLKQRYGTFFEHMNIAVDVSDDLYAQFGAHELVVGDGRSTSFFEACAFAPGRVFILKASGEDEPLPNHAFLQTVAGAADLRRRAGQGSETSLSAIDQVFAPNWRERFVDFLSQVLPGRVG